jgi:hypothetical protein
LTTQFLITAAILAIGQVSTARFNPEWSVVFPAEKGPTLLKQCSRAVPGPTQAAWLPEPDTIRQLEIALVPVFQQAANKAVMEGARPGVPSEYYRQYAGIVVEGRRLVYVNGFNASLLELEAQLRPPRPATDWRAVAIDVCDGWTGFFGAEYDPAARTVHNFRFNGRAMLTRRGP